MAGIYNDFKGENKFVILTTNANNSIADVHDRMPIILPKELAEEWILSDNFALSYLHSSMPVLQRETID